jgi:hypothetical protein
MSDGFYDIEVWRGGGYISSVDMRNMLDGCLFDEGSIDVIAWYVWGFSLSGGSWLSLWMTCWAVIRCHAVLIQSSLVVIDDLFAFMTRKQVRMGWQHLLSCTMTQFIGRQTFCSLSWTIALSSQTKRHPPAFNFPKGSFIELSHTHCVGLFQSKSVQDAPHSLFSYFTVQRPFPFHSHHSNITPTHFCHSGTSWVSHSSPTRSAPQTKLSRL